MNLREIKQLLELVREHDLAEFELEREGCKISLKKYSPASSYYPAQPIAIAQTPLAPSSGSLEGKTDETPEDDYETHIISAPIVGTYYAAPSPESDDFTHKGAKIGPDDTVCIIEAMKVMNEIKADVSGTIEEVYVENGQAVEFGQPLFKVRL